MGIGDGEQRSLEETPTWAVSVCCFIVLVISLIIEGGVHNLVEHLKKKNRKSMGKALSKTKAGSSSRDSNSSKLDQIPSTNESGYRVNYCEAKGMVSLISSDGVLELNILISILAVFHILYCTLTMCLGKAKAGSGQGQHVTEVLSLILPALYLGCAIWWDCLAQRPPSLSYSSWQRQRKSGNHCQRGDMSHLSLVR
ncbi:MLO-like protein 12-like [Trifolium pratense]|uniref:MLO-like protein 12-like n=1 Tax=Trifolium pratense TaxID=57577 RepID=A0A2K3KZP0_TRIPR|nr:MLO-like protein 12-like [Trifolium pratense]